MAKKAEGNDKQQEVGTTGSSDEGQSSSAFDENRYKKITRHVARTARSIKASSQITEARKQFAAIKKLPNPRTRKTLAQTYNLTQNTVFKLFKLAQKHGSPNSLVVDFLELIAENDLHLFGQNKKEVARTTAPNELPNGDQPPPLDKKEKIKTLFLDASNPNQLSRALKTARKEAGFTQVEVAELMGTKQGAIQRLEGGKHNPTVDSLWRYAEAIGYKLQISFQPDE